MRPEGRRERVVGILYARAYKAEPGLVRGRLSALLKIGDTTPGTWAWVRCCLSPLFPRSIWQSWGKGKRKPSRSLLLPLLPRAFGSCGS